MKELDSRVLEQYHTSLRNGRGQAEPEAREVFAEYIVDLINSADRDHQIEGISILLQLFEEVFKDEHDLAKHYNYSVGELEERLHNRLGTTGRHFQRFSFKG